jgi:formate hydrogenlyase subunit 4
MRDTLFHVALLVAGPLTLLGVIARVKALVARRRGPPLLQPWFDVAKLLRKGAVYSRTTTFLFAAGPIVALACTLLAALLVPLAGVEAPVAFPGDVFVFAGLLALARFATMVSALDTGSAFEGMGASREAAFAAMAEPALFLVLMVATLPGQVPSFSTAFNALSGTGGLLRDPVLLLAAIAFGAFLLTDLSRMPIDDPNTHLELTMIHEVMILDHSGPDLAFLTVTYAMRLWVLSAIGVHLLVPIPADAPATALAILLGGQVAIAVGVGLVESMTARLRLTRIPQFLIGASVIAAIGVLVLHLGGRS